MRGSRIRGLLGSTFMLQVRYLTAGRGVDEGMENDDARRDVTFPCLGTRGSVNF